MAKSRDLAAVWEVLRRIEEKLDYHIRQELVRDKAKLESELQQVNRLLNPLPILNLPEDE